MVIEDYSSSASVSREAAGQRPLPEHLVQNHRARRSHVERILQPEHGYLGKTKNDNGIVAMRANNKSHRTGKPGYVGLVVVVSGNQGVSDWWVCWGYLGS